MAAYEGLHGSTLNNGSISLQTAFAMTGAKLQKWQEKMEAPLRRQREEEERKAAFLTQVQNQREECGLLENVTDGDWERYFERAKTHRKVLEQERRQKEQRKREDPRTEKERLLEQKRAQLYDLRRAKVMKQGGSGKLNLFKKTRKGVQKVSARPPVQ